MELKILDKISEEILNYVKKEKVISGTSILAKYILKNFRNNQITGKQIRNTLEYLVRNGDLLDLYSKNVDPNKAGMSETYYVKMLTMHLEHPEVQTKTQERTS